MNVALDGTAAEVTSANLHVPTSGFMSGTLTSSPIVFQVLKRVNQPTLCNSIRFINTPGALSIGDNSFKLDISAGDSINGHFSWTNGEYALSYVPYDIDDSNNKMGTWIVGPTAGKAIGYIGYRV